LTLSLGIFPEFLLCLPMFHDKLVDGPRTFAVLHTTCTQLTTSQRLIMSISWGYVSILFPPSFLAGIVILVCIISYKAHFAFYYGHFVSY